jgi:large subunit ribosomal protein L9
MKVILTQDVEKLGNTHDIVEVANGYASNYLMPRGMAISANRSAMANLDAMKKVEERRQNRLKGAAQLEADKVAGKTLVIEANTGKEGRLYGSISNADIAEALTAQFGVVVDRRQVMLADPIRMAGVHSVAVHLHRDVKIEVPVQVGDLSQLPAPVEAPAEAEAETAEVAA